MVAAAMTTVTRTVMVRAAEVLMVGAVVVCAFMPFRMGPLNSQGLAKAMRWKKGSSGPRYSSW